MNSQLAIEEAVPRNRDSDPSDHPHHARRAKGALERVCSGAGLDPASRYYSPSFVDHVNDLEFYGLAGARADRITEP